MRHVILRHCRALLLAATLGSQAMLAHAVPENGWWWNPAENGRGFFIEVEQNVLVLAGYLYAEDGRASWLLSAGPMATPDAYSGRLLSFSGGQTLFGDYQLPAAGADAGPIALAFTDDTHAKLTWPGGEIPIERQMIGGRTPEFDPTGWWWNPAESGRGFSLEVRDTTMFIAGYMYDDAGQPVWYISAGPMATSTRYEGTLLQVAGGQTLTGAYQAPTSSNAVGTLAIEFASADDATLTLNDSGATAARSPHGVVKGASGYKEINVPLKKQNPQSKPSAPPTLAYQISLEGPIFRQTISSNQVIGQTAKTVYESKRIVWLQTTDPDLAPLDGEISFRLYEGSAPLKVVYAETNIGCSTTGTVNLPVKSSDGFLYLNLVTKAYRGEIKQPAVETLYFTTTCHDYTYVNPQPIQVGFKFEGTATLFQGDYTSYFNLFGNEPQIILDFPPVHTVTSGDWRFTQRY